MRIGIFAGTFDPIHRGHVAFAQAAAKQLNLDKVLVMPERSPRGKLASSFEHRVRMTRLATGPHRKLKTVVLDDERFTVQYTLPKLEALYPDAELVMLVGSDVVHTFGMRWPHLDVLLAKVELAISLRVGESEEAVRAMLDELSIPVRASIVQGPHPHLSATEVRSGNLQGIEPLVRQYIEQNQLYQPQVQSA
jgi:nicotinate-nucleotide adenylyltransferase